MTWLLYEGDTKYQGVDRSVCIINVYPFHRRTSPLVCSANEWLVSIRMKHWRLDSQDASVYSMQMETCQLLCIANQCNVNGALAITQIPTKDVLKSACSFHFKKNQSTVLIVQINELFFYRNGKPTDNVNRRSPKGTVM